MAPYVPDEIDVFTAPHCRMKELVNIYTQKIEHIDYSDGSEVVSLLRGLDSTLREFKSHESIENIFIMDQLKNRLKQRQISNTAVCDCHADNRLADVVQVMKTGIGVRQSSVGERLRFGQRLQQAFHEFVSNFLPHMEEEEQVFQPLLVEHFEYEELKILKEVVLKEHEVVKEQGREKGQREDDLRAGETCQDLKDLRDLDCLHLEELCEPQENTSDSYCQQNGTSESLSQQDRISNSTSDSIHLQNSTLDADCQQKNPINTLNISESLCDSLCQQVQEGKSHQAYQHDVTSDSFGQQENATDICHQDSNLDSLYNQKRAFLNTEHHDLFFSTNEGYGEQAWKERLEYYDGERDIVHVSPEEQDELCHQGSYDNDTYVAKLSPEDEIDLYIQKDKRASHDNDTSITQITPEERVEIFTLDDRQEIYDNDNYKTYSILEDRIKVYIPEATIENLRPSTTPSLPGEVLVEIFRYLTPLDLCRCAQVCQDWNVAAYTPALWSHLNPVQWARGIWVSHNVGLGEALEDAAAGRGAGGSGTAKWDEDADVDEAEQQPDPLALRERSVLQGLIEWVLPRVGCGVKSLVVEAGRGVTSRLLHHTLRLCPSITSLQAAHTLIDLYAFKGVWARGLSRLSHLDLSGCHLVDDTALTYLARCGPLYQHQGSLYRPITGTQQQPNSVPLYHPNSVAQHQPNPVPIYEPNPVLLYQPNPVPLYQPNSLPLNQPNPVPLYEPGDQSWGHSGGGQFCNHCTCRRSMTDLHNCGVEQYGNGTHRYRNGISAPVNGTHIGGTCAHNQQQQRYVVSEGSLKYNDLFDALAMRSSETDIEEVYHHSQSHNGKRAPHISPEYLDSNLMTEYPYWEENPHHDSRQLESTCYQNDHQLSRGSDRVSRAEDLPLSRHKPNHIQGNEICQMAVSSTRMQQNGNQMQRHHVKPRGMQLETLSLSGCWRVTDAGLGALAGAMAISNLTTLDVSGCYRLSGRGLGALADACPALTPDNLWYCDNIIDGPYPLQANGCANLANPIKACCRNRR